MTDTTTMIINIPGHGQIETRRNASLIAFDIDVAPVKTSIHFGIPPSRWGWGRTYEPYDMCMTNLRFGPLASLHSVISCPMYDLMWWIPGRIARDDEGLGSMWRDFWEGIESGELVSDIRRAGAESIGDIITSAVETLVAALPHPAQTSCSDDEPDVGGPV
jgi:hypothetical protein